MPKIKRNKLSIREELFVNSLPKCNWIAYEAVKAAGYRCKNNQIAQVIASHLVKKGKVSEAIERLKEARLKKLGIHHERILRNRAMVAESDPSAFFTEAGTIKPPSEWTPEMRGCVAGFEVVELFEGKGEDRKWIGYLKKIKFTDRNSAQHDLMDHAGLLSDRGTKIDLTVNLQTEKSDMELAARFVYWGKLLIEREQKALQGKQPQLENKAIEDNRG